MKYYPKQYSFLRTLHECKFIKLEIVLTEDEIIEEYFEDWKNVMVELGEEDGVSEQSCIEDFVLVTNAVEEDMPESQPYVNGVVRMDYKMWKEYERWSAHKQWLASEGIVEPL